MTFYVYGPLEALLADPDVWEIMVNPPDAVFVRRHLGVSGYHSEVFHDDEHVVRTLTNRGRARPGRLGDPRSPPRARICSAPGGGGPVGAAAPATGAVTAASVADVDNEARRRPDRLRLLAWAVAAVAVLEQARLSWTVGRSLVHYDQTLFWVAAREWGRFHVHQPNYYGQSYGSTIEAIPLELLRRAGVSLWTGFPVLMGVFAVAGWFLLAAAAWRRGHRVLALMALASPIVLGGQYQFFVTEVPDAPGVRFLVVAGVAGLLLRPATTWATASAFTAVGLGCALEPGSGLLAAPVVLWWLIADPPRGARLRGVLVGAVLPAAYAVWWFSFYRAHPDYNFHGSLSVNPSWDHFVDATGRLDRLFFLYAPELLSQWVWPVAVGVALVVLLLWTRRARYVVPALIVPAVVAVGMASERSDSDLGEFFPPGRIFLALPYALWFLAYLVAESGVLAPRLPSRRVLVAGVAGLALLTAGIRAVDFHDLVWRRREASTQPSPYTFQDVRRLWDRCGEAEDAAEDAGTDLVVYTRSSLLAYGCAAYRELDTLVPGYERRTWRLYEEREARRTAFVLSGVGDADDYCRYAAPRVRSCSEAAPGVVTLRTDPLSAMAVLERLQEPARDFGPDCVIRLNAFGARSCDHPDVLSPSELTTGAPADEGAARRAIAAAAADALPLVGPEAETAIEPGPAREVPADDEELRELARDLEGLRVDDVTFWGEGLASVDLEVVREDGARCPVSGQAVEVGGRWRLTAGLVEHAVRIGALCES